MSILKLQKATLIGLTEHKAQLLDQLQTLGVLHIIPLSSKKMRESHRPQEADVSPEDQHFYGSAVSVLTVCV